METCLPCHSCHRLLPYSLYPILCTVALILPSISLLVLNLSLSFPITTQEQLTIVSCLLTYNYLLTDLPTSSLAFSNQFSTLQRHFSKIKSSQGPPFFKILQSSPLLLDKECGFSISMACKALMISERFAWTASSGGSCPAPVLPVFTQCLDVGKALSAFA